MNCFLGAVNHYQCMWAQQVHIIAPGKKTFCWTDKMDLAFKCMKALMAQDSLLVYHYHNKPFHIYTDTSSYLMGACIVQDNNTVAFWFCKLNDIQLKYMFETIKFSSLSWS